MTWKMPNYKRRTDEEKQKEIDDLLSKAEEGIKAVYESERYKNYLDTMAKFHTYSVNNQILIMQQNPEATHVAGYNRWKNDFNRQVIKGEKSIKIIGYTPKKIEVQQDKKDRYGNTVIGAGGTPEKETVTKTIPRFKPMSVFDISQTEGEPLPTLVDELDGSVKDYSNLMTCLSNISPYPISFEPIRGDAKGYCNYTDGRIVIKEGMEETQTLKTAIHEVTHAVLHEPQDKEILDRSTKEIEAESAAYVVAYTYGVDTSDYSFPYIATWSSDKEPKELHDSLQRIKDHAASIIGGINEELENVRETETLSLDENRQLENIRYNNMLDTVRHDNDIDADMEKTTKQHGTPNIAYNKSTIIPLNERINAAKTKANEKNERREERPSHMEKQAEMER